MVTLDIGAATDVGKVREHNEDCHEFVHSSRGDLLVVCDGMGGHACGDVASRTACDEIVASILKLKISDPRELVYRAIELAHQAVRSLAKDDETKRGMGTTCVVAFIREGAVWLGHVGDSRAYLIRNGNVEQRTIDQTKVQRLLDEGIITPAEAKTHPDAGVISQAIGQDKDLVPFVTPEEAGIPLHPGDALFLCTDGTYDCLRASEIAALALAADVQRAAAGIVSLATDRDGKDNATAIVAILRGPQVPVVRPAATDGPTGLLPPRSGVSPTQPMGEPETYWTRMRVPAAIVLLSGVVAGALALWWLKPANAPGSGGVPSSPSASVGAARSVPAFSQRVPPRPAPAGKPSGAGGEGEAPPPDASSSGDDASVSAPTSPTTSLSAPHPAGPPHTNGQQRHSGPKADGGMPR